MKEKAIPVGIFQKEIFIAVYRDGKLKDFNVIRPVDTETMDALRDPDSYQDYCEDLWKCAVQAGSTKLGLVDFAQELIDEADCDNDDEAFPCKDDSYTEYLTPEMRKEADEFLSWYNHIDVGTWESAGGYAPNSFNKDFKKFDYVFNNDESRKAANEYLKSLK